MSALPLCLLVGFLLFERIAEALATRQPFWRWRLRGDWTLGLVLAPYGLTVAGVMLEYLHRAPALQPWQWLGGIVLLAGGVLLRTRAVLDLRGGFSPLIEARPGQRLITTGLYRQIRHPAYLGTLLFLTGGAVLLDARWSWLLVALSAAAFVVRLRREERYLAAHLPGYAEYARGTWALLPRVW